VRLPPVVRDAPYLPHEGCGSAQLDPDHGGDFSPLMAMVVASGFIHGEKKDEAGTRIHARPAESGLIFVPRSSEFVSYLVATILRAVIGSSYRSHGLNIFSHKCGKILTEGARCR
jgi:hypothetical protein